MLRPVQGVPNKSVRSWIDQVDELRAQRGMSQDDLAYEARRFGAPKSFTGSWISQLRQERRPLTAAVLEGLAGALDIAPETFVEYQLAMARRQLDERELGLETAYANLRELEAAAATAEPLLPAPRKDGLLARSLAAHRSTPEAPPGEAKSAADRSRSGRSRRKAA